MSRNRSDADECHLYTARSDVLRLTRTKTRLFMLPKCAGGGELHFHAGPALARAFFRRACAVPVSFETDGETIAVAFQRGELADPIDRAAAHGGPIVVSAARFGCDVFAVAMPDAVLGQE